MSCWVTSSHIFEWNDVKAGLSCQIQQMIDNLCQTYTSKSVIYTSSSSCYRAAELQFGTRSHVFTCIYCIFSINSMFKFIESFRLEKTVKISTSNQQPFKQHGPMLWRKTVLHLYESYEQTPSKLSFPSSFIDADVTNQHLR